MKISLITAAFNAAGTIGDTLRSIRNQDWPDFEHIVVDGASTDATMNTVEQFDHPRLIALSEPDKGCYDAMNKGLARATGDIVAFVNADDFLARNDVLTEIAHCFIRTGADAVGGQTVIVAPGRLDRPRRLYRSRGFGKWMLRFGHMPPHPSLYVKRDRLIALGGFDTRYRITADFDQLVKLFLDPTLKFEALEMPLSIFREGGLSTRGLQSRLRINSEILQSLRRNRVRSHPLLLWGRYPTKAIQIANARRMGPLL